MQEFVNYARGWSWVVVTGAFPERMINLCAQQSVTFWTVEWQDAQTLRMSVLRRDIKKARELAERAGCTLREERKLGLPNFLARFRHRYAFLVGLALSVLAVCFASNFVCTIEVTGNERVPDAVILSQLRREGLRPGVYGPKLDTRQMELNTRIALEELAWISINLYGTRVQVVVRETVPPPELLEQEGVSDIVARAGGLVLSVDAVQGQAVVVPGSIVAPGETLISGTVTMDPPQYSDIAPSYLYVRAAGDVQARTWRSLRAAIPRDVTVKRYTGQRCTRWSLTIFERRINFYRNGSISWENCDKISKTYKINLPGGQSLPFTLTREQLVCWEPAQVQVDADAAQELLHTQLQHRLEQLIGEDGQVLHTNWNACIGDDLVTLTGSAECQEQIGTPTPARQNDGDHATE